MGGTNVIGTHGNSPMGTFMSAKDTFHLKTVDGVSPYPSQFHVAVGEGFDTLIVPPRKDHKPWSLDLCIQWIGSLWDEFDVAPASNHPDPIGAMNTVSRINLVNGTFIGPCFQGFPIPFPTTPGFTVDGIDVPSVYGQCSSNRMGSGVNGFQVVDTGTTSPAGNRMLYQAKIRSVDPLLPVHIQVPFSSTAAGALVPGRPNLVSPSGLNDLPNLFQLCLQEIADEPLFWTTLGGLVKPVAGNAYDAPIEEVPPEELVSVFSSLPVSSRKRRLVVSPEEKE
jgi:hypothetical protein